MQRPIRVLIVEDYDDLGMLYRQVLGCHSDMHVVDVLASAKPLLSGQLACSADVVLLDLHIPGEDPLAIIPTVAPDCHVVVVSGESAPEFVARAFKAGARGYVVKSMTYTDDLPEAIRTVFRGGQFGRQPSRAAAPALT